MGAGPSTGISTPHHSRRGPHLTVSIFLNEASEEMEDGGVEDFQGKRKQEGDISETRKARLQKKLAGGRRAGLRVCDHPKVSPATPKVIFFSLSAEGKLQKVGCVR